MSDKIITVTIELLGKYYSIRCPVEEEAALQQAAQYLNQKMLEVQDSGKTINLERIAIISALNVTYQFLQHDQQKTSMISKINQRISHLQDKIDTAIKKPFQTELIYATELD